MTKEEFIKWAESEGWGKDKYGHLRKAIQQIQHRFKDEYPDEYNKAMYVSV